MLQALSASLSGMVLADPGLPRADSDVQVAAAECFKFQGCPAGAQCTIYFGSEGEPFSGLRCKFPSPETP